MFRDLRRKNAEVEHFKALLAAESIKWLDYAVEESGRISPSAAGTQLQMRS